MLARWKILMGRLILQEKTPKIEEKSMFFKNLFLLNDGCWQRCENRKAYFCFWNNDSHYTTIFSGSKVTLAARVDSFHESTDGHIGMEYKEDIEKKIDKVVYHNCIIFYLILLPPPFLITSSYPSLPPCSCCFQRVYRRTFKYRGH